MNKSIKSYGYRYYITVFIVVIGLLLPCKVVAQNKDKSSLPTIISFKVTHKTTDGVNGNKINWIEFSWKTEGANKIRLYKNGIEIKSRSQLASGEFGWSLSMIKGFSVQHKKPAIYELVAENNLGKVSRNLNIQLKKRISPISMQPKILDFRVMPQNIKPDEQVSFYWQVKNAYQVRLYDSFGEIISRIELPKGNYGWPLSMNANYMENLNKSETYKLVVTGKNGTVSRSVKVLVSGKKCKLIVSITGRAYKKYTDGIGVFKVIPNSPNKFLFKRGVNVVHNQGKISYKSTIYLPFGNYNLVPSGGGKDKYGYFGVLYKPRSFDFTCRGGNTKHVIVKADVAEY